MPYNGKTKEDHEKFIEELFAEIDTQQSELATAITKLNKFVEKKIGYTECYEAIDKVHRDICELFRKITHYKYK